jgi:hypothetical protein
MDRGRVRRPKLALTMGQMMKLVVLSAAASLCLVPMRPMVQAGVVSVIAVLLFESIAMPLAMALAAFLVVRPGPARDGLILALVMAAMVDAIGVGAFLLGQGAGLRGALYPVFLITVMMVLGMPLLMILLYITPGTCPRCERSRLYSAGTFRPRPGSLLRRTYRCGSCQARFWNDQGAWRAIPDPASGRK